ncbi:MAG: DUF4266 domain-containing protein [Methylomonas sp.]|nr:DUF4266 domain-containing protein [Methylomonas sp.]
MKLVRTATIVVIGLCACACSPVAPWQRGKLAKPQMALEPYPLQNTFIGHIYNSREASGAVGSTGGGGCGCN